VIYKPPLPTSGLEGPLAEELATLKKELHALNEEKTTNKEQVDVLKQFSATLKAETTEAVDLGKFIDVFASKRREVFKDDTRIDEKVEALTKKIKKLNARAHADEESKKRGTQITVVVLAEADGPAELLLSYGQSLSYFPDSEPRFSSLSRPHI
jgi:hypothetical protein